MIRLGIVNSNRSPPPHMWMAHPSPFRLYQRVAFPLQAIDMNDYQIGKFSPFGTVARPVAAHDRMMYNLSIETITGDLLTPPRPWCVARVSGWRSLAGYSSYYKKLLLVRIRISGTYQRHSTFAAPGLSDLAQDETPVVHTGYCIPYRRNTSV